MTSPLVLMAALADAQPLSEILKKLENAIAEFPENERHDKNSKHYHSIDMHCTLLTMKVHADNGCLEQAIKTEKLVRPVDPDISKG